MGRSPEIPKGHRADCDRRFPFSSTANSRESSSKAARASGSLRASFWAMGAREAAPPSLPSAILRLPAWAAAGLSPSARAREKQPFSPSFNETGMRTMRQGSEPAALERGPGFRPGSARSPPRPRAAARSRLADAPSPVQAAESHSPSPSPRGRRRNSAPFPSRELSKNSREKAGWASKSR